MNKTVKEVARLFDGFEFGEAGRALYNFIWNDFCDWYIEMAKEDLNGSDEKLKHNTQNILCYVLDQTLRLMHPIMPFVTEKIWLTMPHDGKSLVTAAYPVEHPEFDNPEAEKQMDNLIELIKAVRNSRASVNAPMSSAIDILIRTTSEDTKSVFDANVEYINRFCHPKKLEISADVEAPALSMTSVITGAEVYLPLADLIDLNEEHARLEKEASKLEKEVERGEKKLSNERFVANAPAEVVNSEKEKLAGYKSKLEATKLRIEQLEKEM